MTAEGKKHATIASHGTQSWQESRENTLDETARTDQVSDAEGLIVEADEPNHTYGRHPLEGASHRSIEQGRPRVTQEKIAKTQPAAVCTHVYNKLLHGGFADLRHGEAYYEVHSLWSLFSFPLHKGTYRTLSGL